MTTFSERIKSLRVKCNWRQKDVASKLEITESAYGYYEQGRREPSNDTLKQLSEIFGVTSDYLLGITDNPQGNIDISYDGGGLDVEDEDEEEYLKEQLELYRKRKKLMLERLAKDKEKE